MKGPLTKKGNPAASDFKLSDFPIYLISTFVREYYGLMDRVFEDFGLDRDTYRALLVLKDKDGLSITEISEKTGMQRPTTGRLVHRMEQLGLILRHTSTDDQRVINVHVQPKGKTLTAQVCDAVSPYYDLAFDGMSAKELDRFAEHLRHMTTNLRNAHYRIRP